jgi:hypothetical protein
MTPGEIARSYWGRRCTTPPGLPDTLALMTSAGCICRHLEYDQHPELHAFVIAQRAQRGLSAGHGT